MNFVSHSFIIKSNMTGVLALLFLVALLQTATSVQYAQKLCNKEDDCDFDQCCINASTRLHGFKGICSNPTQKGEICNPNPRDKTEGRYRIACPCDEGLSCQSKEKTSEKKDFQHVCEP